jgi:hypothetical protein
MMDLSDITVSEEFFSPLTTVCEGRPRCAKFLRTWVTYAKKSRNDDDFSVDDHTPRILYASKMVLTKPSDVIYAARIATTICTWFGTNIGFSFMEKLEAQLDYEAPSFNNIRNTETVLSLWAIENSLVSNSARLGIGTRLLKHIISDAADSDNQTLTALETDCAEHFMVWLATEDGRTLLKLLKQTSEKFFEQEKSK